MSQPSEKPSIVVVGSSNTDMVIKADHLPVPGETILGGEFMMAAGGKGANQAVAAARLGGRVTLVSRVGNDSLGEQAIAGYRAEGIDTSLIQRDEKPTGVALILVDNKGQNVISVAPGANYRLSPADADRAEEVIAQAKMVVVQLETPLDTIERTAKIAARHGVPVILDPAPAPSQPLSDELLASITYIKPNQTEASRLTGIDVVDEKSAQQAAEVLLAKGAARGDRHPGGRRGFGRPGRGTGAAAPVEKGRRGRRHRGRGLLLRRDGGRPGRRKIAPRGGPLRHRRGGDQRHPHGGPAVASLRPGAGRALERWSAAAKKAPPEKLLPRAPWGRTLLFRWARGIISPGHGASLFKNVKHPAPARPHGRKASEVKICLCQNDSKRFHRSGNVSIF